MNLNIEWLKIRTNNVQPEKGRILIAEPLLPDFIFSRSVILITDEMDNSYAGYILNHYSGMKVGDVMEDFENMDYDLFIGGPVDHDVLHFIHNYGDFITNSEQIKGDLYVGGDYEDVLNLAKSGLLDPNRIRFFIGYSGWGTGQLKDELSDNSWLVTDAEDDFFISKHENMWERSLEFVHTRYNVWKNFPEDPSWN
jgi:putative transcriptional regulator